ncbi:MAG: aminotransferase class V-fold PLP-dependent enzyme [Gaiellaceae bacterium]
MADLTRRALLMRAGLAAGTLALAGSETTEAAPDLRKWSDVRAQFDLDPRRIHLASFVFASHPRPVRRAIELHRRGLDADPFGYLHAHEGPLTNRVREAAAQHLGVPSAEIALTDSTTMALGLLYTRLRLRPADEVLTTEHDFYATHEALRLSGAQVRRTRLYDDPQRASVDEIVARLRRAISKRTRVVALTWVHSSTGVRLPIRAIRDALPDRIILCVDGVHGLGAVATTLGSLGCDAFAAGCHKWLYGPRGTGVLWANDRVRELLPPAIPSFDDPESYGAWLGGYTPTGTADGARLTPGGYHSFEHRWALADAFAFQHAIGRRRVEARIRTLATRLKRGLADTPRVRLRTPVQGDLSAGIVCFERDGTDPQTAVTRLLTKRIVASTTPYRPSYVRLGPGIVNSVADIDAAVRAVAAL